MCPLNVLVFKNVGANISAHQSNTVINYVYDCNRHLCLKYHINKMLRGALKG